jgi:phospholipid/cholesterol/gamma-HCH transport system ATP-binding protein
MQLQLTSVVVTHDLELMRKVADRVVFLSEGKVAYFGPVDGLETCDHEQLQEFLRLDRIA